MSSHLNYFISLRIVGGNISASVDEVVSALTLLSGLSPVTFPEEIDIKRLEWLQDLLDRNKIQVRDAFRKVRIKV